MAASPNLLWYQQMVSLFGCFCGGPGECSLRPPLDVPLFSLVSDCRETRSLATSALSCSTSLVCGFVTAAITGVTTSATLSASSANSSRVEAAGAVAKTILILAGKRCKNNSLRNVLSRVPALSPSSCCICRRSCVGFLSPNSSKRKCFCSLLCSGGAVLLISSFFRVSYGLVSGGFRIRSLTSVATSGDREAMT